MAAALLAINGQIMVLVDARKKEMEEGTTKLHNGKRSFLDHLVWEQKERGELTDEQVARLT